MKKKINILNIYIIINILYMLIASFLWKYRYISFNYYSYGYICFLVLNIVFIIIISLKKKYKKNIIDLLLLLCIFFGCISVLFAYNKYFAIFGFMNRNEGLLQICYYMSILFLSSFVKKKKYIIYTMLFTGFIQVIYGFLQVMDVYDFIHVKHKGVTDALGMMSNSNFFGTYMLICLSYSVGFYFDEKHNDKGIIYYVLYIIFTIGLFISNALSSVVGFIGVLIYIIIYSIIKKTYKKMFVILFTFVLILFGLTKVDMTTISNELISLGNETVEISKGNLNDNFGTDRMYVWKETVKLIPKYWLTGVGIDNFYYIYDGKPITMYNGIVCYDKAHNEYLQVLVTQGVFALITYILLFSIILFIGIKESYCHNKLYLVLPIGGYLIQAFFNISVIEVAPLFYMGLGFLINRNNKVL